MKPFILEDFLEERKDRIERTENGLISLRAPKKRRGRTKKKEETLKTKDSSDVTQGRKRRGRPRKRAVKESLDDGEKGEKLKRSPGPGSKQVSRPLVSTDFLNTTNFKVGQELSDMKNEEKDDETIVM